MKKKKILWIIILIILFTLALTVNMHAVNETFKDILVYTLGPASLILMLWYARIDKESMLAEEKAQRIIQIAYSCSMILLILLAVSYYS
jgi:amino acid permease